MAGLFFSEKKKEFMGQLDRLLTDGHIEKQTYDIALKAVASMQNAPLAWKTMQQYIDAMMLSSWIEKSGGARISKIYQMVSEKKYSDDDLKKALFEALPDSFSKKFPKEAGRVIDSVLANPAYRDSIVDLVKKHVSPEHGFGKRF